MQIAYLLSLVAFAYYAQVDGSFASHCEHVSIVNGKDHTDLQANCGGQCNVLNLDLCYASHHGGISAQDQGHFNSLCYPNTCSLDGTTLNCVCYYDDAEGRRRNSFTDLNELISADGGILTCFGNKGTILQAC
ncbi:uncharacterized protein F4822DRAFT_432695 [Hypoxylon trugodes]|uniref:uncharacterized protein n=1 Tax=Hypoxylon trugodes TaxID=326681 RepID=UPI00218DEC7F|nr:uncharacterized protein F4822DRAFT_432695 [Hypoxylon trugodes]KAI1385837.1 hypothetical protein F4822DRAFT_432695 [Hypoxylon trugodes]